MDYGHGSKPINGEFSGSYNKPILGPTSSIYVLGSKEVSS